MKISIPGLGGRLQRARKEAGFNQALAGERIGVSWMTVHRWERSQRAISEEHLARACEFYNRPLRWFLTLETGDLDWERGLPEEQPSAVANRISSAISEAPSEHRPMIEKIAEDVLDGLRRLN